MKITAVGHATMFVETQSVSVLIDPVLTDEFMGGTAAPHPQRRLEHRLMPSPDVVVISHFHAGHLEPESLAMISRDTAIAIPHDPTVQGVVEALGFTQVLVASPGQEIQHGHTRIGFTGSGQNSPYLGVTVADSEGTFWYMGDRGDTLPMNLIAQVVDRLGGVDVVVASHPSDYFSYLLHSTCDGGADESETHTEWLQRAVHTIDLVGARLVLPQTTDFLYSGSAAWLNRYAFPMRPKEFVDMIRMVLPNRPIDLLTPGDSVIVEGRSPRIGRGVSPWVAATGATDPRGLDLTEPAPVIQDQDPFGLGDEELRDRIELYLANELVPWLRTHDGDYRPMIRRLAAVGASYRLTIVLPSGATQAWTIRWTDGCVVLDQTESSAAPSYNQLHTRIAASTLDRWTRDEIPYFVAGVEARRAGMIRDIAVTSSGRVNSEAVPARCLVSAHLLADRSRLDRWLVHEVERLTERLANR